MTNVDVIVSDYLKASANFEKKLKRMSPGQRKQFARQFLTRAGILDKSGTKIAKRYR